MIRRFMRDVTFLKSTVVKDRHGSETFLLEEYFKTKCTIFDKEGKGLLNEPFSAVIRNKIIIYIKDKKDVKVGNFAEINENGLIVAYRISKVSEFNNHLKIALKRV